MLTADTQDIFERIWSRLHTDRLCVLLRELDPRPHGDNYLEVNCPGCGVHHGYIYTPKQARGPHIHCNRQGSCGYDRPLWEWVKEQHGGDGKAALAALADLTEVSLVDHKPPTVKERRRADLSRRFSVPPIPEESTTSTVPTEWKSALGKRYPLDGTEGAAYLESRGIYPVNVAHDADVRFGTVYGLPAVIFPVRDRQGRVVAAQGRYVDPEANPKTRTAGEKSRGVFATKGAWDAETLIVVEGPMDALSLASEGYPAIALLGTAWPDWFLSACAFRSVWVALDADDAGDKAAEKLIAALLAKGARTERVRTPVGKDWNDSLVAGGVGSLRDFVARMQDSEGEEVFADTSKREEIPGACIECGAASGGYMYCLKHDPYGEGQN